MNLRDDGTGRAAASVRAAPRRRRRRARAFLVAAAPFAAGLLCSPAPAPADPDEPPRRLPFSDDLPPPPPLPEPLDRRFHGKLVSFDGDRVKYRWEWKDAAELADFEPFVPVRATVSGGFTWREGGVEARGTGGIRLRLGMLSDLRITTEGMLLDPHDLGVVLSNQGSSDESILCLVQDRLFTNFDRAAGNATMINKLGGIPAAVRETVEFRYIARSGRPMLGEGHRVALDVLRSGKETVFTITPRKEEAVVLKGVDTDTPFTNFQAGLYVAGSSADFGPVEIEGKIDPAWCLVNGVLPHLADDLLHAGNRFQGAVRKAAETVEKYAKQDPETADPKTLVLPETVAAYVGDDKLPLVIRMRAAEALADAGAAAGGVAERVARLLDAKDLETRVLAWRVLRPRLPWHFRYDPDGDPAKRRESAVLVGHFLHEQPDEEAQGKVFVDGYWYTPSRADQVRAEFANAWDLRTPRVRLRTNLPKAWADWYLAALEAEYREIVRVVGREPPADRLPLSVLVFSKKDDFTAFCNANGYEAKAAWGRFADLDTGVALDTFAEPAAPLGAMNLLAKLYLRAATGISWPSWFEEGRASWFGNPDYRTGSYDGKELKVGLPARGGAPQFVTTRADQGKLWGIAEFLEKDPRSLDADDRRLWYAYAWALHAFLMGPAPESDRKRFAEWQAALERLKPGPREVESVGRRLFLSYFQRDLPGLDERLRAWVKTL